MKAKEYKPIADQFARDVIAGVRVAGREVIAACNRYLKDLKRDDLEMRTKDPDTICSLIEGFFVHQKGEDPEGNPLLGKPFLLQPWQIFVIVNLFGFYYKGTNERRYKEAFIEVPRKNGKTSFIAGLAFAVGILQRASNSTIYIVSNALKQALQSFEFLNFNLRYKKLDEEFKILNNSFSHSISYTFTGADGRPNGQLYIEALAANPDSQDSFNCNFAIADEVAAYKKPAQYNRFKEAMKAYRNKMMVGITTAGDNVNSFGYHRQEYAVKVAMGIVDDDSLFALVARADQDQKGNVDYEDPIQHQKANLSYGVTVTAEDLLHDSIEAKNAPEKRKDFLSRSLNIYTAQLKSYFDIEEFKASDREYSWKMEDLRKLPINWYGGADLSKMHDLTATCLYGNYDGVDIVIPHGFFPVTQAVKKEEEDGIPLYQWKDEGTLTLCNSPTVNYSDIVNWFIDMRRMGFKIRSIGFDRKFAEEFYLSMESHGFPIKDQPQYFNIKSSGFRHIEKQAKDGKLYYMHSSAYEYCVSNVHGIEKVDDMIQYEKIERTQRIDLFDASVFAAYQYINEMKRAAKAASWWGE